VRLGLFFTLYIRRNDSVSDLTSYEAPTHQGVRAARVAVCNLQERAHRFRVHRLPHGLPSITRYHTQERSASQPKHESHAPHDAPARPSTVPTNVIKTDVVTSTMLHGRWTDDRIAAHSTSVVTVTPRTVMHAWPKTLARAKPS